MNRIRSIILGATLAALSVGCAATGTPNHRVGAVNNYAAPPSETLTLGASTVHSASRLMLSIDLLSIHVVSTGTGTGTWSLEISSDNASWSAVTLPASPPAASGSPQDFWIIYDLFEFPYARLTYAGASGSGSATVSWTMKG